MDLIKTRGVVKTNLQFMIVDFSTSKILISLNEREDLFRGDGRCFGSVTTTDLKRENGLSGASDRW